MIHRIKVFNLLSILLFPLYVFSNDGAYYASGNQLIPIKETDISVKKEILILKKIDNNSLSVTVYYEFFNPKSEKELLIGFEAYSPSGDVDGTPVKEMHPYINNFTVKFNETIVPYKVNIVEDSLYGDRGNIKSIPLKKAISLIENTNEVPFFYVYNFKAKFKTGINVVQHTYSFNLSGGVSYDYYFDYVLTAAKRWANNQIDDFTLIIDMGDYQDFYLSNSFFKSSTDWVIAGIGKAENDNIPYYSQDESKLKFTRFMIRSGNLIFRKINFKPEGEIFLASIRDQYIDVFDADKDNVSLKLFQTYPAKAKNGFSLKVLKNLPYAKRGYIFSNTDLEKYFKNQSWYIPDINYQPKTEDLTNEENYWLKQLALLDE